MDQAPILLVSMPFGPLLLPSLTLSLLKAEIERGLRSPAKALYFTLAFAERMGARRYTEIADGFPISSDLVGEWIFASALFETPPSDPQAYIEQVLRDLCPERWSSRPADDEFIKVILDAREAVPDFLDDCLTAALRAQPCIVVFTSTGHQHVASLALARRIKTASPCTFVVFTGLNCEGVMGVQTLRQFPFVDAVISGDAEAVFVDLVRCLLEDRVPSGLPGVRTQEMIVGSVGPFPNAVLHAMDALPYPDFSDFFAQYHAAHLGEHCTPALAFETARGCWWGAKMHCTFCGLNGATMQQRKKSTPRAVAELADLVDRYPGLEISVADYILDMHYFEDLLPQLAQRSLNARLFFYVKPNVKKEHLRRLRDAAVTTIQPGIESFSTPVLRLMRKGLTGIQNIQFLKWCKEIGIAPVWHLLFGFPGEPPGEYERMAALLPRLFHLPPPEFFWRFRLERFSPNYENAERLGLANVRSAPAYRHIYPFEPEIVVNLARHFTFDYAEPRDVRGYAQPVLERVQEWRQAAASSYLVLVDRGDHLVVRDLRPSAAESRTILTGIERAVYLFCDTIQTTRKIQEFVAPLEGRRLEREEIEELLDPLYTRGLMVREGDQHLSLAIPLGECIPSAAILPKLLGETQPVAG